MEAIKKDELFDDALCGMVKFTDATTAAQKPAGPEKKAESKLHEREKKVAQKPTSEPEDAEYEPVKTWYEFPSPCGDELFRLNARKDTIMKKVSVPLRG